MKRTAARVLPAALLLMTAACAGSRVATTPSAPPANPSARGYRALFKGEAERADGHDRFRLAVALLPPDRLRLEFFAGGGGPRLVIAADAGQATALLPGERTWDRSEDTAATFERFVGVPLGAAGLVALLTGQPMCAPDAVRVDVMTRPAATFGRTLSWVQVSCPPSDIRYQARCEERGGTLLQAMVSEGISGTLLLDADYGDYDKGLGPRWPRHLRVRLPGKGAAVDLVAVEGPEPSEVPESLFRPEVPDGFERRSLKLFPDGPGLPATAAPSR